MIFLIIFIFLLPIIYNFIPISKNASSVFYINSSNIDNITNTLEKSGYTVTFIDKYMLKIIDLPKKGWYSLDKNEYGRLIFFANMTNKKSSNTMNIVIYPGETSEKIIKRLANDMKLDEKKLRVEYDKLSNFGEADIFARRYTIARDADEASTIQYIFSVSNSMLEKWKAKNLKKDIDNTRIKKLFIIASIIQKESNSKKEMPIISSVIYNRLKKNMKLQMDATLNYGKYSNVIVTPKRIREDKSKYNTYKHKGLPPAPLGSVTKKALDAARYPASTKYLFFMLKPDGSHVFSDTYKKHLENIKLFRLYQQKKKKEKEDQKKLKKEIKKSKEAEKKLEKKKEDQNFEMLKKLKDINESNESNKSNTKSTNQKKI